MPIAGDNPPMTPLHNSESKTGGNLRELRSVTGYLMADQRYLKAAAIIAF